jgi:hypothetical protein
MDKPLFPALFSINMLIGTSEGRSYTEKQLVNMLENAGVKRSGVSILKALRNQVFFAVL